MTCRRIAWRSAIAAAALVFAAGGARAEEGGLFRLSPENISTYGGEVDSLYQVILWLTVATFVITEAVLLYFLFRFRAKPGGRAVHTHGSHKLEVAWTTVPAVILVWLAFYQFGTWSRIKIAMPDPSEGLVVQVMAKQFEWHFRYAGPDGTFGTNDDIQTQALHVPVNTKVTLLLRTQDVLHSFFVPSLRLKQDTVPGLTIRQWFEATKTTEDMRPSWKAHEESMRALHRKRLEAEAQSVAKESGVAATQVTEATLDALIAERASRRTYEIACAELCGLGHTRMRGELHVHTKDEFFKWLDGVYVADVREFGVKEDAPIAMYWPKKDAAATPLVVEDSWLKAEWPAALKAAWPKSDGK
jgi:cytochrome c oxidase subunit 2